jgi:hypothetical protein
MKLRIYSRSWSNGVPAPFMAFPPAFLHQIHPVHFPPSPLPNFEAMFDYRKNLNPEPPEDPTAKLETPAPKTVHVVVPVFLKVAVHAAPDELAAEVAAVEFVRAMPGFEKPGSHTVHVQSIITPLVS